MFLCYSPTCTMINREHSFSDASRQLQICIFLANELLSNCFRHFRFNCSFTCSLAVVKHNTNIGYENSSFRRQRRSEGDNYLDSKSVLRFGWRISERDFTSKTILCIRKIPRIYSERFLKYEYMEYDIKSYGHIKG